VVKKDFAPIFVKNERYTAQLFVTAGTSDHFFQSELSDFADTLFFKDQMNLFEAYNGLVKANSLNPSLSLSGAIKHLEGTYGHILRRNDTFREIEGAISQPLSSSEVNRQIGGGI
jgi:hypothetical protein